MATSGSSDFTVTRDQIIKGALRIVRAYTVGESAPEPEQSVNASEALNMVLKSLSTKGALLWTQTEATLYLLKGQPSYTVGPTTSNDLVIPRPTKIVNARLNTGDEDIPIHLLGRSEYFDLNDKTTQGRPTQYYYDRQVTDGVIYVYPTPNDSTEAIKFTYERVLEDFDTSSNTPDLPPEWFRWLKWALASEIAIEYGVKADRLAYIEQKAAMLEKELLDSEVEGFVQFEPHEEDYSW